VNNSQPSLPPPHSRTEIVILVVLVTILGIAAIVLIELTGGFR